MKVIVAMSGGVDSSVAAYLLKKQGFDVIGLSFELWDRRDLSSSNACCSLETIELAKSVANKIGIKHYTADVRDAFYSHVIETFCESYIKGVTPNPCILCNKYIKFDFLLKKAKERDADFISTGHYARIESQGSGVRGQGGNRRLLKKGIDPIKDQSYVLYVMKQEELAKTIFPLGEMKKEETRQIAKDIGLANALRAESQEICFIGDDNYSDFIKNFSPEALQPGKIFDTSGKVLGEHKGIAFYTIGQRRGLGISALKPNYVVDINHKNNTIIVGSRDDAMGKNLKVKDLNWIYIDSITAPIKAHVKIRSTMKEKPSTIHPLKDNRVLIEFDDPQWAPASGQSAVFYQGDLVIGGGIIE
ncbi:MAG: tRNA 2-thiouridine(34) synthase MnmA [Nitrospirae bacterium]|nr:tRNA 2-thiouridine(34) synthase MnmA [Nitrospirota bacterium]